MFTQLFIQSFIRSFILCTFMSVSYVFAQEEEMGAAPYLMVEEVFSAITVTNPRGQEHSFVLGQIVLP